MTAFRPSEKMEGENVRCICDFQNESFAAGNGQRFFGHAVLKTVRFYFYFFGVTFYVSLAYKELDAIFLGALGGNCCQLLTWGLQDA